MINIHDQGRKKYVILGLILAIGSVAYVSNATASSLWYDECVEYFFSKYVTGTVPGSIGTSGMYENITSTYQPPLYNVLMHLWLLIFDSEFWFRLAGIITTLVGAIGIFKAIDEQLKDDIWTEIGTLIYVFTSSVVYYALECAEYNLMLCFLAWTTYFYIRFIKRQNILSLIGFFIFAVLSVYSQYGAAFIVVGMYALIFAVASRNKKLLLADLTATGITFVVAALPLIYFFLLPQMAHQAGGGVSHVPNFDKNCLIDYAIGVARILSMGFCVNGARYVKYIILGGVCVAVLFVLIVAFYRKKEIYHFIVVLLITYTLYFVAVACSIYGYNSWSNTIGTQNLGGRYTLFFIPFIIITLVVGMRCFWNIVKDKKFYKLFQLICMAGVAVFCIGEVTALSVGWEKDDIREVTMAWYENNAYDVPTLVHQWDDAMFHFYLIHDDRYDVSYHEKVEVAGMWSRTADYEIMEEQLGDMGYFDMQGFYYISPSYQYSDSLIAFRQVIEDKEFHIEEIYEGKSTLLHITK